MVFADNDIRCGCRRPDRRDHGALVFRKARMALIGRDCRCMRGLGHHQRSNQETVTSRETGDVPQLRTESISFRRASRAEREVYDEWLENECDEA